MENRELQRIIIYTYDVVVLTGKSKRSARRLLEQVRAVYGRRRFEMVPIKEFCEYYSLDVEEVKQKLKSNEGE